MRNSACVLFSFTALRHALTTRAAPARHISIMRHAQLCDNADDAAATADRAGRAPDGALPSCAAAQAQARAVPPHNCDRLSDVCARAWRRYKERLAALSTPVEVGPATLRFELLPRPGHRHNKFAIRYVTAC